MIDIDKHRRLAAHASLRPWGISQGMLVSVDPTGLKLVVADCNYENGTPNLYFLANIANDHAAMLDEIDRLRERLANITSSLHEVAQKLQNGMDAHPNSSCDIFATLLYMHGLWFGRDLTAAKETTDG